MALDTKARAAQGTVVQLKSELAQSQHSRTEAKVLLADCSQVNERIRILCRGLECRYWLEVRPNARKTQGSQSQEQHEDQLITDTTDLKMTEDARGRHSSN